MKDFDWTSFTRKIAIKATLKEIYDAWTITSEIERWFLERAIFTNAKDNVIPKHQNIAAGDAYEWS